MNTTELSDLRLVETSHPPSTRPATEHEPSKLPRQSRRTSWLSRLVAKWRRPRVEIDPYTAHQNELERVQREAAYARALVYYGGFR